MASAFSVMEILRVLYDDILKFDPKNPSLASRDRFILSKGQGCMAQYVMLADKGFYAEEELWQFCKSEGLLGGHPETRIPGVEASTGALGHGMSIGIGFALNARHDKNGARTFVVIGDGESNEGSVWEAAMCAGKHKLSNFTVIVDYNKHMSYGSIFDIQNMEPFADKWRAFGFGVMEADGHNVDQLRSAFAKLPFEQDKPNVVLCHTIKGKGVDFTENNMEWHHKSRVSAEEIQALYAGLGD
jgi:transketolase